MVKDKLFYSLNSDLLEDEMREEMQARKTRYTQGNTQWDYISTAAIVIMVGGILTLIAEYTGLTDLFIASFE